MVEIGLSGFFADRIRFPGVERRKSGEAGITAVVHTIHAPTTTYNHILMF